MALSNELERQQYLTESVINNGCSVVQLSEIRRQGHKGTCSFLASLHWWGENEESDMISSVDKCPSSRYFPATKLTCEPRLGDAP